MFAHLPSFFYSQAKFWRAREGREKSFFAEAFFRKRKINLRFQRIAQRDAEWWIIEKRKNNNNTNSSRNCGGVDFPPGCHMLSRRVTLLGAIVQQKPLWQQNQELNRTPTVSLKIELARDRSSAPFNECESFSSFHVVHSDRVLLDSCHPDGWQFRWLFPIEPTFAEPKWH